MTHNRIPDTFLAVPPEVDGPWENCPSAAAMRLWLRVWTHGQPVDRATLKTMTGQHRGPAIRTVRKAIDAGLLVPVDATPRKQPNGIPGI